MPCFFLIFFEQLYFRERFWYVSVAFFLFFEIRCNIFLSVYVIIIITTYYYFLII